MQIKMVYTGTIRKTLLFYMLDILKELSEFELHLYGPNNIIVPDFDFVIKHGAVSHDAALAAQVNADILISMGVKGTVFIAAKIFEYMSTGKPIIHFFSDDFDPNVPYYKEYRNAVCINVNDAIKQNSEKIKNFIEKPSMQIRYDDLKKVFYKCEPEYTFNVIHDSLGI
jgi:hypothetical protein